MLMPSDLEQDCPDCGDSGKEYADGKWVGPCPLCLGIGAVPTTQGIVLLNFLARQGNYLARQMDAPPPQAEPTP